MYITTSSSYLVMFLLQLQLGLRVFQFPVGECVLLRGSLLVRLSLLERAHLKLLLVEELRATLLDFRRVKVFVYKRTNYL